MYNGLHVHYTSNLLLELGEDIMEILEFGDKEKDKIIFHHFLEKRFYDYFHHIPHFQITRIMNM